LTVGTLPVDEILAAARVAGVSLRVVGGDLAARPAEAVTPELVALLRENKPRIIAALRREPAGALDVGGLLRLIESNPRLAQVARTCAKGVFNGEHRLGASAYREGSVGVLAGALSSYYGQYESNSWRAWLPAARAVLQSGGYGEEGVMEEYPYVWAWGKWPCFEWGVPGLYKGMRCRVLARSSRMNSAAIEFENGHRTITSRNGLRKAQP
jgi:hypothetical protein